MIVNLLIENNEDCGIFVGKRLSPPVNIHHWEPRKRVLHCSKDGIVHHSIVDRPPARLDELAGADHRGMADDGDEIALAARLDPQHAKAVVLIMKGHALDKAREVLAVGGRSWRFHTRESLFFYEITNAACSQFEQRAPLPKASINSAHGTLTRAKRRLSGAVAASFSATDAEALWNLVWSQSSRQG